MQHLNHRYSEIIKNNPLLTKEEEYTLAKKCKNGDVLAREKLISSNYRLVKYIAKKYHRNNINFEDLLQESSIGLIKAVDRFDPDLGYKFSTYASWWIKQAALQYINENLTDIKVPTHSRLLNAKIKKSSDKLASNLGRSPTINEIAKDLDESAKKIKYTIKANTALKELDKEKDDHTNSIKNNVVDDSPYIDPEASLLSKELDQLIKESLSLLTIKEEKILRLRFGISASSNDTENFPVTETMKKYIFENEQEEMDKLIND